MLVPCESCGASPLVDKGVAFCPNHHHPDYAKRCPSSVPMKVENWNRLNKGRSKE